MNKKPQPKTSIIEENVMHKIHDKKTVIRPRSYYLYLSALSVIAIVLLVFITTYFMSIATLWLRIQSAAGPAYGAKQNLNTLLGSFPWWALLLGIISLVGITYLVKKTGRMYKIRLIYLIPLVIVASIVIGFIFSYSALPGMFNGHRSNISCETDDINCTSSGRGYNRNR
ncbi:MAG: hypothetical protein WCK26_03305 [Candidatus Saccharibacteria bacterium]|jgi:hypothetical protein